MLERVLKDKRVLVLGGTGAIGQLLLPYIHAASPKALMVTGTAETPKERIPVDCDYLRVALPDEIAALPKDCDVIINLAAVARPAKAESDPIQALRVNLLSVISLIDYLADSDQNPSLVLVSSVRSATLDSIYAWTKVAAEAVGASYNGIRTITLRLGNVIKTSPSLAAILKSIVSQQGGLVAAAREYYQPSYSLDAALGFVLGDRDYVPSGSIVTPLLSSIPIPFAAGYLAGREHAKQGDFSNLWDPDYQDAATSSSPLIPYWWCPSSQTLEFTLGDQKVGFVITNFKEFKYGKKKTDRTWQDINEFTRPKFGRFVADLEREGVLSA